MTTLIFGLSLSGIDRVAAAFRLTMPTRLVGAYLAFVGIGLASVWLAMWAAYAFAGRPTPVEPEVFKLVAALDLSIMAPLLASGGVLLWRRSAWGYIIATIAGVQGSLYLLVLSVSSIVAIRRGLAQAPGELPIWGTLALSMATATLVLLRNARPVQGSAFRLSSSS